MNKRCSRASLSSEVDRCEVTLKVRHPGLLAGIKGDKTPPFQGLLVGAESKTSISRPHIVDYELFALLNQNAKYLSKDKKGTINRQVVIGDEPPLRVENFSAYPAEYAMEALLYHCPHCLDHMPNWITFERHRRKCNVRCPPGREIYRHGTLSLFQVEGLQAISYCRSLCLLAKLFLNSKALFHDVEPFLFYVLVRKEDRACSLVGYFSKNKLFEPLSDGLENRHTAPIKNINSKDPINLSCIVVLPRPKNKGLGQFLISVSYLLTRLERSTGSPERPLSSAGLRAYEHYWSRTLSRTALALFHSNSVISVDKLSKLTGITPNDVIYCFEQLGMMSNGKVELDYKILQTIANKQGPVIPDANQRQIVWAPCTYN